MKTLATCKPTEFLQQTNKIRKSVEKWLTNTDIINIYKTMPKLKTVPPGATLEERKTIAEENKEIARAQSKENWTRILDQILEEHPEGTLELLSLCCFIEPENIDEHETGELLDAFAELVSDSSVINFFTSVVLLGQISTSAVSRR